MRTSTRPARRWRRRLAAVPLLAALPLFAAAPATAGGTSYVSLGDSYTSGPLIPNQVNLLCTRSDHNYPHLVAGAIGATLTDASCGGAQTKDMTGSQLPTVAPQFDALRPDTDLVTVSIGGNDIGFAEIVGTCGAMGAVNPNGHPCTDHYTAGGTDQVAARLAALRPTLTAVVQGIRQRSPHARVLFVGVPDDLPLTGSCWGSNMPIAPGDYPYLIKVNRGINATYQAGAAAAGAEYVDLFTGSVGHDVCQPTGTRWVEGIFPHDLAAPVHPNALGMRGAARAVAAAITG